MLTLLIVMFVVAFILSFTILTIGLISPKSIIFRGKTFLRKDYLKVYGSAMFIAFFCLVMTAIFTTNKTSKESTNLGQVENNLKITNKESNKHFSMISVDRIEQINQKINVSGRTDLPDGSLINITINPTGRLSEEEYIGTSVDTKIHNGKFQEMLYMPERPEFYVKNNRYIVSVLFTPMAQDKIITGIVGEKGENLIGKFVNNEYGFSILEFNDEFTINLKAQNNEYKIINPELYPKGSAKWTLAKFMKYWEKKNWNEAVKYTQTSWADSKGQDAVEELESFFGFKSLIGYKILDHNSVSKIKIQVYYGVSNKVYSKIITVNVINEDGKWGVNPLSMLREE